MSQFLKQKNMAEFRRNSYDNNFRNSHALPSPTARSPLQTGAIYSLPAPFYPAKPYPVHSYPVQPYPVQPSGYPAGSASFYPQPYYTYPQTPYLPDSVNFTNSQLNIILIAILILVSLDLIFVRPNKNNNVLPLPSNIASDQ